MKIRGTVGNAASTLLELTLKFIDNLVPFLKKKIVKSRGCMGAMCGTS